MSNERSRDWCFTVNNYSDEDISMLADMSSNVMYMVYGKEVAKTGTLHLQGYVYFTDAKTFSKMRKILPKGSHIEKTKGTPQHASDYCKKGEQSKEEWDLLGTKGPNYGKNADYKEYGKLPEKQGKRNDIVKIKDLIEEGKTMNDVIEVATSYQSLRTAELLFKYKEPKRDWKPSVLWIYGKSGLGKTRLAHMLYPDLYRKTNSNGRWFEGYDAHKNVLFDDVKNNSQEYYEFLLEALDRYECRVECKGASRQFLAENIVLTSILHPAIIYHNFNQGYELIRRIDKIQNIEDYINETFKN